ncbi:MAG: 3-oxoacyl-ACP reductase family protein [Bacillota bacterium]|nr:3-oxoacyl-ACP reductase family protein [Bacillota bacterium]
MNKQAISRPICLVTGSSRGIGAAIVNELSKSGIAMVINYRSSKESAHKLAEECRASGGNPLLVQADIRYSEEVDRMFKVIETERGKVDLLVNNAGVDLRALVTETTDDEWQKVMDTNLKGPFLCCRRALPHMIRQHYGRIINIASVWGLRGASYESVYAASKGGLIALTRSLAREVGNAGITVNALAPGPIETDMLTGELDVEEKQVLIEEIPVSRLGRPQEIASACRYLCSEEAAFINGQVLVIDGGWTV